MCLEALYITLSATYYVYLAENKMPIDKSEFFREVTLRICGSLDIGEALSQVFEFVEKHMPVDGMGLAHTDLSKARTSPVARVARKGFRFFWEDGASEIPLPEDYVEHIRGKPPDRPTVWIGNPSDHPPAVVLRTFPQFELNSSLGLQLDIRGEDVGLLVVSAEGADRYSPTDAALLETVREPFAIAMSNARRYQELVRIKDLLAEDNRALAADIKRAAGVQVVGADFGLREVMEHVRRVASSSSPTLLLGETGTGKEVIANAIHTASPRSQGPMISLQCGAVPESLLDSELFGHERGAFTGASERKRGRFERADGGTLFLDEIGELSPEAQVKLLRVLQERRIERVGGTKTIEVDVRVIAATHRDLDKMVREAKFREDLWYRLNVLPIRIPPLRLRREDIPSLVQYFVELKAKEMNLLRTPRIANHELERLKAYNWPGNVRELQNIVERALILSRGDGLRFPDLPRSHIAPDSPRTIPSAETMMTMDEAIADHIRAVLERVGWQVAGKGGAAELLKMNPSTLRFRMKQLGISRRRM